MSRKNTRSKRLQRARQGARAAARRQLVTTRAEIPEQEEESLTSAEAPSPDPAPEPVPPPVPSIRFACEEFRATIREATAMIRRHADELALTGLPWPFRPALNMMAEMCEDGRGVWLVARDGEGTMIGYALFLLGPGMFLRDTLVSTCVALYVDPEWRVRGLRPVGLRFLQFCESEMRGRGAGLLEIAAMEGSALAGFLPKLAYVPAQTVLWKNLEETP